MKRIPILGLAALLLIGLFLAACQIDDKTDIAYFLNPNEGETQAVTGPEEPELIDEEPVEEEPVEPDPIEEEPIEEEPVDEEPEEESEEEPVEPEPIDEYVIEDYTKKLGTFEGLDAVTEWQILRDAYVIYKKPALLYDRENPFEASQVVLEILGIDQDTWIKNYVKEIDNKLELGVNNMSIRKYGGTYNDYIVLIINGHDSVGAHVGMTQPCCFTFVEGIGFFDTWQSYIPYVWNEGQFYGLQEAYDNGWLTIENLQSISTAFVSRGGFPL